MKWKPIVESKPSLREALIIGTKDLDPSLMATILITATETFGHDFVEMLENKICFTTSEQNSIPYILSKIASKEN